MASQHQFVYLTVSCVLAAPLVTVWVVGFCLELWDDRRRAKKRARLRAVSLSISEKEGHA